MIKRELAAKLQQMAKKFPVVAILGPRQSGKTTLAQNVFKKHIYVSLEDLDKREFAERDPRGFLETYQDGAGVILDEIQNASNLLSYIQTEVDRKQKAGHFIITGSQNFLINQAIAQTLAGRIYIFTLLPLTIDELKVQKMLPQKVETLLFQGFYPRIYSKKIAPSDWYPGYIQTYVERDVRLVQNISNLTLFQRFIKLCAGRIGQLLNLTSLGNDCGISANTARSWLSLLEASYLIFLLYPHHQNFSKRLIKMPKIYFFDTGLACSLLEIESSQDLTTHYLRGGLFESFVISELMKERYNLGRKPNCFFWRDKTGHEIDCILENGKQLIPVEIKAGKTITQDYFHNLHKWTQLAHLDPASGFVIYAGDEMQKRREGTALSWKNFKSHLL